MTDKDQVLSSDHYDEEYFEWQSQLGEFGSKANRFLFESAFSEEDVVIDFGCGGGFMLGSLPAREKIGIEPNTAAAPLIARNGLRHFGSSKAALAELGGGYADVVISGSALEHALHPLTELMNLRELLRSGGRIHFVVPCESVRVRWKRGDINNHLYTWSPMNLGNLFTEAGFDVDEVKPVWHKWPRGYRRISSVSWRLFHICARIWGRIDTRLVTVAITARKAA